MICEDHPTIPISLLITAIKLVFFFLKNRRFELLLGRRGKCGCKGARKAIWRQNGPGIGG
jgi:hypothetical protein